MSNLKTLIGDNNFVGDVLDEAEITGFTTPLLNLRLLLLHGDREVFHLFLDIPYEDVVLLVATEYGELWQRLIMAYADLDGLTDYRQITETVTSTKDNTTERDNTDSTAAFNSPELVPEGGANETTTGNEQGEVLRDLTERNFKLGDLINSMSLLRRNGIIEIINNDIARFLTLTVY